MSFDSAQMLEQSHPERGVQDDANKLIRGMVTHIQETGCIHCKSQVLEYLKNTQPIKQGVLENDKTWYGLVDSNNRQDVI